VLNKDLNALEQELGAAHRAGTADAFCLYLYGLILTDRHDWPPQPVCLRMQAHDPCVATGLTHIHVNAGSARLMLRRCSWHLSPLTHATGAHGRSALRDCHCHACQVVQPCHTVLLLLLVTGCSPTGAGDPVRRERWHPRPDAATALDARLLSSAPLPRDAAQRRRPQPPSGATCSARRCACSSDVLA